MKNNPYKLYQSPIITNHHSHIVETCKKAYGFIEQKYGKNSTWEYEKYNLFSLTSSSFLFFKLYKELNYYIRDFIGDIEKPLWITSWLNYHERQEVENQLPPHSHPWDYHGYICIDPKDTTTIFHKGYKIKNKTGQIYIGKGSGQNNENPDLTHYVKINTPYEGNRITIGFDIATKQNMTLTNSHFYPLL